MGSKKKTGGTSARACDSCIRRRARWFCAADDAFLCQSCDASVHSANPLALRHERVRLKTQPPDLSDLLPGVPTKPRTRSRFRGGTRHESIAFVPEYNNSNSNNPTHEENEEQFVYRVPTYEDCSNGFANSLDFAADVESLLGKGLDEEEYFSMEGLGLGLGFVDSVKVEEDDDDVEGDVANQVEWGFEYDEDKYKVMSEMEKKKKIELRLDYEKVISAWANHKSPWTSGHRPELHCWPDYMGICGSVHHPRGEMGVVVSSGREARVSRYREKRRTRLFSKKIRYQVRKLNAEKRPRMKGRFVKRTSNFP